MKRSRAITLVLLGGGVVLTLGGCGDPQREECERARRELRPDAEQICAAASSSRSSYHRTGGSWFWGRSGSATASSFRSASFSRSGSSATSVASSSRGGFGGTASRFSGSGS